MKGLTVRLFLVDGTPHGVITAEIMNWTGKLLVVPRASLSDLADREEVKKTGIYLLVGDDQDSVGKEVVYIGESDNVWNRLVTHNKDPKNEFWGRTVIVVGKDENLTKSHVRYLEARLISVTQGSYRAKVLNANAPELPALPEADIADMESFLDQVRLLLPVVGFGSLFGVNTSKIDKEGGPLFTINYGGVKARAREVDGDFIVLRGSTVRKKSVPSLANGPRSIREQLAKDGTFEDAFDPDFWVFKKDVPFSSPSAASDVVTGASTSGRKHWKVEPTGESYGDWQSKRLI